MIPLCLKRGAYKGQSHPEGKLWVSCLSPGAASPQGAHQSGQLLFVWGAPAADCQSHDVMFVHLYVWTWTDWQPQWSGLLVDPHRRHHSS